MLSGLPVPTLATSQSAPLLDNGHRLRITAEGKLRAAVDVNYVGLLAEAKGGIVMGHNTPAQVAARKKLLEEQRKKREEAQGAESGTDAASTKGDGQVVRSTNADIVWPEPKKRRPRLSNGKVAVGLGPKPPVKPFSRSDTDPQQEHVSELELGTKRRVFRLRRELSRSRSMAANMQLNATKVNAGLEVRNMTRYLQGAHLSGSVKQVTPATPEQVKEIATALIQHLHDTRIEPGERNWYRIFREYDSNGDGHLEYREIVDMIRHHIRMTERQMPEKKIQSVWHYIDADGNGWIDAGEFGRFFRLGEAAFREEQRQGKYTNFNKRGKDNLPRPVETPADRKREFSLAELNIKATVASIEKFEIEEIKLTQQIQKTSSTLPTTGEGAASPSKNFLPPLR